MMNSAHFKVTLELERRQFLILLTVFVVSALMSVISQIFLPEILKLSGYQIIGLPEPSLFAIFNDYWGDLLVTSAIVAVIYGITTFSPDLDVDKRIFYYLNHPISRSQYYLGKSVARICSIILVIMLSSTVAYLLGLTRFPAINFGSFLIAALILGLGSASYLAVILLINAKYSTTTSMLLGLVFLVVQLLIGFLVPYFDWVNWLSINGLTTIWVEIITNNTYDHVLTNLFALLGWTIIPILLGSLIYDRRDL